MALAPSFDLSSIPSISIIRLSIKACPNASNPIKDGAMISLTLDTALRTPLPAYRDLSPSRSSTASFSPVLAPDGTEAEDCVPSLSSTKTRTVGFPRESSISIARNLEMVARAIAFSFLDMFKKRT